MPQAKRAGRSLGVLQEILSSMSTTAVSSDAICLVASADPRDEALSPTSKCAWMPNGTGQFTLSMQRSSAWYETSCLVHSCLESLIMSKSFSSGKACYHLPEIEAIKTTWKELDNKPVEWEKFQTQRRQHIKSVYKVCRITQCCTKNDHSYVPALRSLSHVGQSSCQS